MLRCLMRARTAREVTPSRRAASATLTHSPGGSPVIAALVPVRSAEHGPVAPPEPTGTTRQRCRRGPGCGGRIAPARAEPPLLVEVQRPPTSSRRLALAYLHQ